MVHWLTTKFGVWSDPIDEANCCFSRAGTCARSPDRVFCLYGRVCCRDTFHQSSKALGQGVITFLNYPTDEAGGQKRLTEHFQILLTGDNGRESISCQSVYF
ncbi:hypothetical protein CDAR_83491 [Caerostris darwini]|uniref:Uncharacterized protein n=1 Tax=Caerostris darwini TaxID=1538125 RepID=A0AAV4NFE4_9ARAC|nr:hypothetical protein CDAR_83491 [Caerostris darwini]